MHQIKPYPLRLDGELRTQAERLAVAQDRSLNWQLNELVKMGLANFAGENKKNPERRREAVIRVFCQTPY